MDLQSNWIEDTNRFALAKPPDWWLKQLHDFDPSLVIVPSRQSPVYRLAQRRKLSLPMQMVNDKLFNESDTKLLAAYSLIPVTSIVNLPNWSDPRMFLELNNRAPHRLGGAEKVIEKLETQEAKEEIDKRQYIDDYLNYLSKDAWGLYNKKVGLRTHMYVPRSRSEMVSGNRAPAVHIK